jgi:formylglycine-generating enzyme required for sulfatase activity
MIIWENIFGTYNPWRIEDRLTWRRAVSILRHFKGNFSSEAWEPFYPTMRKGLFANRWPGERATVFTLVNHGEAIKEGGLLEAAFRDGTVYFDAWNGRQLSSEKAGQKVRVLGSIDRLGCIVAVDENKVDKCLRELLAKQQKQARQEIPRDDLRNSAKSVEHPEAVGITKLKAYKEAPDGMVFVPKTMFDMKVKHSRRECGCYPDPRTQDEKQRDFLWGEPFYGKITHDISEVEVGPFFMDETEVSNADFKRFLDDTGYRPRESKNFLKHWPNGEIPDELADHPVVYVDIDDARAYAKWAGKRLPTEYEWHVAAQGTDGRKFPWGNKFDESKCNTTGDRTIPVKSYPCGRSPYGCYNMAGNVWEWTESCRDDGHTRFVIIRGGSYFDASQGSIWYVRGGPRPCNTHAKFIRMWPGLDRCATIGFRCVVDAK